MRRIIKDVEMQTGITNQQNSDRRKKMNDVARGSLMLASITLQNVSEAPSGMIPGIFE